MWDGLLSIALAIVAITGMIVISKDGGKNNEKNR
jgi:hypothetical protein